MSISHIAVSGYGTYQEIGLTIKGKINVERTKYRAKYQGLMYLGKVSKSNVFG